MRNYNVTVYESDDHCSSRSFKQFFQAPDWFDAVMYCDSRYGNRYAFLLEE